MTATPTATDSTPARTVVLDTGALISGTDTLFSVDASAASTDFFTTPDVIQELRDPIARNRLTLIEPFLTIRSPSPVSLSFVSDFARATDDFRAFSLTDLRVIALCHTLQLERGDPHVINDVPVKPSSATSIRPFPTISFAELDRIEQQQQQQRLQQEKESDGWTTIPTRPPPRPKSKSSRRNKSNKPKHPSSPVTDLQNSLQPLHLNPPQPNPNPNNHDDQPDDDKHDGDGDGDWITPENLEDHLARELRASPDEPQDTRVACVTTDFAMQNTLLQLGLKLLTADGRRTIRHINRYALRCHSCNAVTRQLDRQFCHSCGNNTLHRVAFKVDRHGVARVFVNPRKGPFLRGTKYSLPTPRGGRNCNDLILCEDQIDPVKQKRIEKRMQKMNVDVLDPSAFYNAGARFNPNDKPVVVGYGRRNPNVVRPSSRKKR